jgi:hypothetical protein
MEIIIFWKTANQFLAGLDLIIGAYILSVAGMTSLLYVKRWLNN